VKGRKTAWPSERTVEIVKMGEKDGDILFGSKAEGVLYKDARKKEGIRNLIG